MTTMKRFGMLMGGLVIAGAQWTSAGAAELIGPSPYLKAGDTPAAFNAHWATGEPCEYDLEDFEDGQLNFGIVINKGAVRDPGEMTDSVDGDDGSVDGIGRDGHSWLHQGDNVLTITFAELLGGAGFVWTDGDTLLTDVVVQAFGPGMSLLGTWNLGDLSDAFYTGTTAEDRFIGIRDPGGIEMLSIQNVGGIGMELDHIHMLSLECVPEPASGLLGLAGGAALLGLVRRRR